MSIQVKELIEKLSTYNPNADVYILVDNEAYPFTITYGGADGCTQVDADEVLLDINENSESELTPEQQAMISQIQEQCDKLCRWFILGTITICTSMLVITCILEYFKH